MEDRVDVERIEYTVIWPVQGVALFSSGGFELVLSDVYWLWIVDEIGATLRDGERLPLIDFVEDDSSDSGWGRERVPVSRDLLRAVVSVSEANAPSFQLLRPPKGIDIPSAERLLSDFRRVVESSLARGYLEVEIE